MYQKPHFGPEEDEVFVQNKANETATKTQWNYNSLVNQINDQNADARARREEEEATDLANLNNVLAVQKAENDRMKFKEQMNK